MQSLVRKSNEPPTDEEAARLTKFIRHTTTELQQLDAQIIRESEQVEASTQAIRNIEAAISRCKSTLVVHEENRSSLQELVNRYDKMKEEVHPPYEHEPRSHSMRDETDSRIAAQVERGANELKAQLESVQNEADVLRAYIVNLEKELIGWQFSKDLAAQYLQYIETHRKHTEECLIHAKVPFSATRRLPEELWIKIFRLSLEDLFLSVIHDHSTSPLFASNHVPFVITLSQVCRRWRAIVLDASELWSCAPIRAHELWPVGDWEILRIFMERSKSAMNLVMDIPTEHPNKSGRSVDMEENLVDASRICKTDLKNRPYSITICVPNSIGCVDMINSILFRQPETLHIVAPQTGVSTAVLHRIRPFKTVQKLSLTNTTFDSSRLPDLFPSVTEVMIQFTAPRTDFYSGFIGGSRLPQFPPQLTRLIVRGVNLWDGLLGSRTGSIQLDQLQVLGVSLPQRDLLRQLVVPALETLMLYDGREDTTSEPSCEHFKGTFSTIKHLKFEDWKQNIDEEHASWGVAAILSNNASHFQHLSTLTFTRSFVEGDGLINLLISAGNAENPSFPHAIQDISIIKCTGITQAECETVRNHVQKLDIFV